MDNGRMNDGELAAAREILAEVRQRIFGAASGDSRLAFALRRYVYKNLSYDERGTPAERTKLKLAKLMEQDGKCAYLDCPVSDRKITKEDEPELDRFDPVEGYTSENTRLVHHSCHRRSQLERGFA